MKKKVVKKKVHYQQDVCNPSTTDFIKLPKDSVVLSSEQKQNYLETIARAFAFVCEYRERVIKGQLTGNLLSDDYEMKKSLEKIIDELDENKDSHISISNQINSMIKAKSNDFISNISYDKSLSEKYNKYLKMQQHPDIAKILDDISAEESEKDNIDFTVDCFEKHKMESVKLKDVIQHYYVRDNNNQAIGVVALCMKDGKIPCRGVSINSEKVFDKVEGKRIAVERLQEAMVNCKSSEPLNRPQTITFKYFANNYFDTEDMFKCGYNVEYSDFEKNIMKHYVKNKDVVVPTPKVNKELYVKSDGTYIVKKYDLHERFKSNYVFDMDEGLIIKNRSGSTSGLPCKTYDIDSDYMFLMGDKKCYRRRTSPHQILKNLFHWSNSCMIVNLDTGRVVKNRWGKSHGF